MTAEANEHPSGTIIHKCGELVNTGCDIKNDAGMRSHHSFIRMARQERTDGRGIWRRRYIGGAVWLSIHELSQTSLHVLYKVVPE